jgi:hypothetical protein
MVASLAANAKYSINSYFLPVPIRIVAGKFDAETRWLACMANRPPNRVFPHFFSRKGPASLLSGPVAAATRLIRGQRPDSVKCWAVEELLTLYLVYRGCGIRGECASAYNTTAMAPENMPRAGRRVQFRQKQYIFFIPKAIAFHLRRNCDVADSIPNYRGIRLLETAPGP